MSEITLYHNAKVHTLETRLPQADWFTTLGDKFQQIGAGPPPEQIKQRVDLGGATVVPGFVDAHTHFFQTGLDRLFIDLSTARNLADIERLLRAGNPGRRTWVFAHSYEEDLLEDVELLTRHHLDEILPETPLWVNRIDYHSSVVNSVALRRLEVPAGTRGLVLEGGRGGQPNGVLRADAYFHGKARVARLYPVETKDRAVKTAASACIEHGITAVHALEGGKVFGDEGVTPILKRMKTLPLDVTIFLQEKNVYFTQQLGFRHLGGCILIDGSIGSYTAALNDDYEGRPGVQGVLYEKPREFAQFVEEAHASGVQLAFHAIGPRAIQQVLDAYERALRKFPRHDHRHRIEHFELATDDQIRQARDLGVIASMQPSFEWFWGGPDGMYASRLGQRWKRTNRLRDVLDGGLVIAGGSDTNVTPPEPLLGIHAAVNLPNPAQRVSVSEALRMFTIDAAYSAFNENRMGSISPGKEASFAVLSRDILSVPPDTIHQTRVLETWFRGRRVYERSSPTKAR